MPNPQHPPMPPQGPASSRLTFLPLSEDLNSSPRGQRLAYLHSGRPGTPKVTRKSFSGRKYEEDVEAGRNSEELFYEDGTPLPPADFPMLGRAVSSTPQRKIERKSSMANVLQTPQMRSQRLIGNSNPRYRWERYYKTEKELGTMKRALRRYYERNNYLIQQYLYIDRLLDSSLPQNLLQEYDVDIPKTIPEEQSSPNGTDPIAANGNGPTTPTATRVKRTKALYRLPNADEQTPLLSHDGHDETGPPPDIPLFNPEEEAETGDRVVTIAIYLNFAANTILLILKIIVTILTSSLSVLASLVDAALDFLSTFIVWITSLMISGGAQDTENFPVGRRRLEPLGVLVFSVIMITSFFQVAIEALNRLMDTKNQEIVQLTIPAIAIMASTVVIKFLCWLWCRLIRNSGVQALAQDAMTDVVFNIFSIIFPLVGYYFKIWWLDPLGGLLLSCYVIINWSRTTWTHVLNLTGKAASADERNILLYLTMRFAKTIRYVQSLQAYSSGDRLNVEVDIVLDEDMSLRDSHDLGESLQYVLESVPGVERAWVHTDYKRINLPSHMEQA